MKIKSISANKLVIRNSPIVLASGFIICGLITFSFAVALRDAIGTWFLEYVLLGAGGFLFLGAYAFTFTTAVFSRDNQTINIHRRSLLNRRGETYPLNNFRGAYLHTFENSKGKTMFAIALKFEGVTISDLKPEQSASKMDVRDLRGIPEFGPNEFPLVNYAENTGKRQKERIINEINAWVSAE